MDETLIDIEAGEELIEQSLDSAERIADEAEAAGLLEQEEQEEEQQAVAEQEDPRNAEKWGLKAYGKEINSMLTGGLKDTASSYLTFTERTADALSGEMKREIEETGTYKPEWDPLRNDNNPILTHTKWGEVGRSLVHFGSLAATIIPAAKVTLARVGIGTTGTIFANSFVRAAGVGAVSDLISKESDGHNALGTLKKQYGFIDTPITTQDSDHPIIWKIKNILEGLGIGTIFDGLAFAVGKGSKRATEIVQNRNASIKKQDIEKSISEIRKGDANFRAAKNRPIADSHQGAHISEQTPYEAWETQKKIRNDWGSEEGSTGSVTTPVQRERIAREGDVSEATAESILKKLYSEEKFQAVIQQVKKSRQTLVEVFGDSINAHQRITQGRNAAELSADEYLEELWKAKDTYQVTNAAGEVVDTIETFTSKNIVTADLVVGTLLHQIRDTGIAGREIADIVDLGDIDGPAAQVIDTMLTALQETKKARIIKSQNFREIGAGKQREVLESTLTADMADTRDSIMSILKIAKEGESDSLMNALFETFSSMKTVNNLDDFDSWARKMIKGGQIAPDGPDRTGALIRELEGMFVHSVLSGPKTPVRAIMGTASATFLRPVATVAGAAIRYPFKGDSNTLRAGLASLNAMMEAIPESFQLFKTKLNSYWSGDVSSIRSRYYEYTRGDDNWEILRRWAEDSGRATTGDRAAFAMANMARNINNTNLFTYSTKIMAATDDAFGYLLGRAKMREKAMRNVLDIQGAGGKLPEINREVMQAYEQDFYSQVFDSNGDILDEAVKFARKEVTLTQELTGFAKGLNDVFTANPWAKPFFLFARTGVNGISLTAKHTPGFNFLVKEFNDIAFASPDNLTNVAKYGINTAEELANAKALQTGRLAMGSGVISLASWSWMSGNLTGNGPTDRRKRQVWMDAGFIPRSIKIGGVWVGYDSFEPFNQILSTIADIGDHSQLMGEEWTEKELLKTSLVIAQAVSSKSYLAGIQQFVDLFAGKEGQAERITAGLLNNTVPLAALRNDIGKLFTPYMRELGSGIDIAIRNRNLITENIASEPLPIKKSILDGRPVREHDFLTRTWNMFSPVNFNFDYTPGQRLLFEAGLDTNMSVYFAPDGTDLTDRPDLRSDFQGKIGEEGLGLELNKLAKNKKMADSIAIMNKDITSGKRGDYNPMDYWHNKKLRQTIEKYKRKAWAKMIEEPDVVEESSIQLEKRRRKASKVRETNVTDVQPILSIYK